VDHLKHAESSRNRLGIDLSAAAALNIRIALSGLPLIEKMARGASGFERDAIGDGAKR